MRHVNRPLNKIDPKPGELRLGNIIQVGYGPTAIVTGISAKAIEVLEIYKIEHKIVKSENLSGCAILDRMSEMIAEDLLLDNGFVVRDERIVYKVLPATPQWLQATITITKDWGNESWHIRYEEGDPKETGEGITFVAYYLHEFQNIYFNITGEHLKQREYLPEITEKATMKVESDQLSKV